MRASRTAILLLSSALLSGTAIGADQWADSPVVGRVDGTAVTSLEVLTQAHKSHGKELLEKLVFRQVVEQAIAKGDIEITPEEIEQTVRRDRQQVEYVDGDLRNGRRLEAEVRRRFNMNMQEYRQLIVRTRIYVKKAVLQRIKPNDTELQVWYRQNLARYSLPERIEVAHILMQPPHGGGRDYGERYHALLRDIRNRVISGEISFEDAARRWSKDTPTRERGGYLGWLIPFAPETNKPNVLFEAVANLRNGQISKVVETGAGLHLVKRLRRKPRHVRPFAEVRDQVMQDYQRDRLVREADGWIRGLVAEAERHTHLDRVLPALQTWAGDDCADNALLDNTAVATVDGRPISLRRYLNALSHQYAGDIAERLLYDRALDRLMEQTGLAVTDNEIEEVLQTDRQRVEGIGGIATGARFDEYLRDEFGMSEEQYARLVVRTRLFVAKEIERRLEPDGPELRLWHACHAVRYIIPAQLELTQIMIPAQENAARETAIKKLKEVRAQVLTGDLSLAEAAEKAGLDKPQKGRLPRSVIPYGRLRGAVPDAAWTMEDGELSEVIVSPAGVHLFRRREMIPRRQPEFEEVYSQVRRDFINERVNLRTQMLMDDLLKATRLERYVQAGLDAFMSAPGSTWERVPLSTAEADTDSGQGSKPQSDNPFSGFSTFD